MSCDHQLFNHDERSSHYGCHSLTRGWIDPGSLEWPRSADLGVVWFAGLEGPGLEVLGA